MAEKRHWLDGLAVGISLVALAFSGLTALRTFLFQRDDIRFVVNESLKVTREKTDFKLDEDQSFTFINLRHSPRSHRRPLRHAGIGDQSESRVRRSAGKIHFFG